MPDSYDCSRNALTERAATQQATAVAARRLTERFAALERRVKELEARERELQVSVDELDRWQQNAAMMDERLDW